MCIEASRACACTIGVLTPARDGDETNAARPVIVTQASRQFVSVDSRQPDVEQRCLRCELERDFQGALGVVGRPHRVSVHRQQQAHHLCRIAIVVHDEHAIGTCDGRGFGLD